MTTDSPLTFTDAEGTSRKLVSVRVTCGQADFYVDAQLPDLIAALAPRGYAVVPVLGTEPTESEVLALDDRGALYNAGRIAGAASRQAEIDEFRASERAMSGEKLGARRPLARAGLRGASGAPAAPSLSAARAPSASELSPVSRNEGGSISTGRDRSG
jgi:hypothetical protein